MSAADLTRLVAIAAASIVEAAAGLLSAAA
jgi:hypothetical protein